MRGLRRARAGDAATIELVETRWRISRFAGGRVARGDPDLMADGKLMIDPENDP
jgi:hypothetical protein